MSMRTLVVGTRGSELALIQTRLVIEMLQVRNGGVRLEIHEKVIRTAGDEGLSTGTGKDSFTKEIDRSLLAGEIDVAVHSLKDVSSEGAFDTGLEIGATPVRESPFDVLISKDGKSTLNSIRDGARIGTSSVRRQMQLKAYRPDFEIVSVHGNVTTRIRKMKSGEWNLDGIVLAEAGLKRLSLAGEITEIIPTEVMLPAVGQGCLAVLVRSDDKETREFLSGIDDQSTRDCVSAERAFSREFGGGCNEPIAALARINGDEMKLEGAVLNPNSGETAAVLRRSLTVSAYDHATLGKDLAREIRRSIEKEA
jgi:hydroxymethylbilane synthase